MKATDVTFQNLSDTAEFTMTVLDNTKENVEAATDIGYELSVRVPDELTEYTDQVFEWAGSLTEFIDFWIDGQRLRRGVDYIAEKGSTKITIKSQPFRNQGGGTHTIAAEFRVNGDVNGELKRAAQNGTVTLSENKAIAGKTVQITVQPDEGYELEQIVVTNKQGNAVAVTKINETTFSFVMPAGGAEIKTTLKKIFIPAEEQPFLDVESGAWYVEWVKYAYNHGLMAGTSSVTFSPETVTSRGMLVTILWRMAGEPEESGCVFGDVDPGAYYGTATCWASKNGIVNGYGDGNYGPNDPVTREQMVMIILNYAKYCGVETDKQADLTGFSDCAEISSSAATAMSWANALGLIRGRNNGILDPKGSTTRAEAATILSQFHSFMKEQAAGQEGEE